MLCPFAADEAFGCGTTTGEFGGGSQRVGDGARQVLARHAQVGLIAAVGDWPAEHFLRCNPTQTQHRNGFEAKVPGRRVVPRAMQVRSVVDGDGDDRNAEDEGANGMRRLVDSSSVGANSQPYFSISRCWAHASEAFGFALG